MGTSRSLGSPWRIQDLSSHLHLLDEKAWVLNLDGGHSCLLLKLNSDFVAHQSVSAMGIISISHLPHCRITHQSITVTH
jgi:hypothetical protein